MKGIGIGLLPVERDAQALIEMSNSVDRLGGLKQRLNERDNRPHLSILHMTGVSAEELSDVRASFLGFSRSSNLSAVLYVSPETISYVEMGWIFLDVARGNSLGALHDSAFSTFRRFLRPPKTERDLSYLSPDERDSFLAYGYRYIGRAFRPHFTLGRLTSNGAPIGLEFQRIFRDYALLDSIAIKSIALFALGPDGACCEVLAQRDFG